MNLISGFFEREAPVVEAVKQVCAEKKMERRRIERERQKMKRQRQVELLKSKAEKKKALEQAKAEERQRQEETDRQAKLAEARTYLQQAKEQQQQARAEAKKQWQEDHAREQGILKQAFLRAQSKQLEKDKERFGARPVTAGGSVVAEAEAQQQREKAAQWWHGGVAGRRAQSAPTSKLPLMTEDSSEFGSLDIDGAHAELYGSEYLDAPTPSAAEATEHTATEQQHETQGATDRSPSRPNMPPPSRRSMKNPRGTLGGLQGRPSTPNLPQSRPRPRSGRPEFHQQIEQVTPNRPISAGRKLVAAHSQVDSLGAAAVIEAQKEEREAREQEILRQSQALTQAQERALALEQQMQDLLEQQQTQQTQQAQLQTQIQAQLEAEMKAQMEKNMQRMWAEREQAMAAQIKDLQDKLKATVEI
jgi:hypothetical protein